MDAPLVSMVAPFVCAVTPLVWSDVAMFVAEAAFVQRMENEKTPVRRGL